VISVRHVVDFIARPSRQF